ncbi:MAG: hypothetical protein K8T89_15845 [Planctomycetes bacterium]|nr:hypothetical protein [Planctomycetota bacterium]
MRKYTLFLYAVGLAVTFGLGYLVAPSATKHSPTQPEKLQVNTEVTEAARIRCAPGPWGDLEYVPITLEAPEHLLPLQAMMENPTKWFFKNFTLVELTRFLEEQDLTRSQKDQLLSPSAHENLTDGILVTPSVEILTSISRNARERIFRRIASVPENGGYFTFVRTKSLDERFQRGGVSSETVELFRNMSCEYGKYLIFSGMPHILSTMGTNEERIRFIKVLTQQKSLLVRLRITPTSDIDSLVSYWDKMGVAPDVKALLNAMSAVQGGVTIDLVKLLPPLATGRIYTFPKRHEPKIGSVKRDCHWTAFNFFSDPLDDGYSDPLYIEKKFKEEYVPVTDAPRYGDLIFLTRPDDSIIHSAIYLADNITFTKNGDTAIHPWMFSTLEELMDQYSFMVEPNQKLVAKYFRNKNH